MNAAERRKLYEEQVGTEALQRQDALKQRQARAVAPKCRSCEAPMRWVVTGRGRRMPVDFDPHEDGNVVVDANGRAEVYRETPMTIDSGSTVHFSHFATCPNAGEHRTASR
jgi:hypothetical protein